MDGEKPPRIDPKVDAAASQFLAHAFAEARREQIIPKLPRGNRWQRYDGPWPPYYAIWEIARSESARPLIAALREAYPNRFGVESKFPFKDPQEYVRAFLQAVIAGTVLRRGRLAANSRISKSMLAELHRVVSMEGQRFGCLWLLHDVDFRGVSTEQIGKLTLYSPSSPPEMLVASLLPGVIWASDQRYPSPGAPHQGLLYGTGSSPGHHWDVTTPLNRAMGRFMQALRLATGTTASLRMIWMGETSMVHVQMPEALPQAEALVFESRWRRVARLAPQDLSGLRRLTAMIVRLEDQQATRPKKEGVLPPVVIAMRRHSRSLRSIPWQDAVLELSTALETCLGPTQKEQEIGLTLRTRAAHLLAHDDSEQADAIYRDITDLYGLRSDIIHGNPELKKDLPTMWEERGYNQVLTEDRMMLLLDRWRDIVRRSITARLMLSDPTLGTPLWPIVGNQPPVDRWLVRRDKRHELRERIVAGAVSYGLPLLADPAPALVDYLHRSEQE
jgi:hypothetical protein